ncbi:MAG: hypothetical protein ABSH41_05410 [Syntrophobacteraceae bacterium]|jgi:hypothetical protein
MKRIKQTIWQRVVLIAFALLMLLVEFVKLDSSGTRSYFTFLPILIAAALVWVALKPNPPAEDEDIIELK